MAWYEPADIRMSAADGRSLLGPSKAHIRRSRTYLANAFDLNPPAGAVIHRERARCATMPRGGVRTGEELGDLAGQPFP